MKHPSVWIGAVVPTAIAAFSTGARFRDKPSDPALIRFSELPPEGTSFGGMPGPAVSPDGRWVVFATVSKDGYITWLRSMGATDAVQLANARGGALLFGLPTAGLSDFLPPTASSSDSICADLQALANSVRCVQLPSTRVEPGTQAE